MAKFKWEGKGKDGKIINGEIEASNSGAAVMQLRKQQIVPLNVKPKKKDSKLFKSDMVMFGSVNQKEAAVFTRQLATMIDAGLPLVQSLEIQAN